MRENRIYLDKRGAIVTGGASGIGFSIVKRLSNSGANVCILDLDQKAINIAVDQIDNQKDSFVIIRYQGESIGCPEMLTPTSALIGYFGNEAPPLATDGRFSGGSHGILIAHLPDAYKKDKQMISLFSFHK